MSALDSLLEANNYLQHPFWREELSSLSWGDAYQRMCGHTFKTTPGSKSILNQATSPLFHWSSLIRATIVCRLKQPLQCSLSNRPVHSPHCRWFLKNVNKTVSFPCLKDSLLWLLILLYHHSLKGHVRSGLVPVIWPDFLSSTHECSRNISLLIFL